MANSRPLIIAIAFGLIAVVLVYVDVRQVKTQAATNEVKMVTVVRATQNIPPRQTITEDMVEEISVPKPMLPPTRSLSPTKFSARFRPPPSTSSRSS